MNTGVGGLSFLQGIFLTQESNQSLLHCRRILHQEVTAKSSAWKILLTFSDRCWTPHLRSPPGLSSSQGAQSVMPGAGLLDRHSAQGTPLWWVKSRCLEGGAQRC
ncbi:hypothetical protein R6Z07M_002718 [Ovis aries]